MKLKHLSGRRRCAHSARPNLIVPLLLGVVSLGVQNVVADVLDPDDYRQIVADMKEDIKTGRATSVSSSADGKWNQPIVLHASLGRTW